MKSILLFLLLIIYSSSAWATKPPKNFRKAKQAGLKVYKELYQQQGKSKTFYCGCEYTRAKKIAKGCAYNKTHSRKRVSWEHIVPAKKMGQALGVWPYNKGTRQWPEWVDKEGDAWVYPQVCKDKFSPRQRNRRCAREISPEFVAAESDLYNLVPAVSNLNSSRGSIDFVELGEKEKTGCLMETRGRREKRRAYIHESLQDNVARIYLYMDDQHFNGELLNAADREKFLNWAKKDKVKPFDCKRAELISKKMGRENKHISKHCRKTSPDLVMNQ